MASVTQENIGHLHDKITVTVSKEDYLPAFEKSIKDFSKRANVPGFRKGMVPAGMIKKMHGPAFFQEEVIRTVEKELQNHLTDKASDIYGSPLPMENTVDTMDMKNPADYTFSFEIGYRPELNFDALKAAKPTQYSVVVTDEMVEEEVEKMTLKNGELKDKEEISGPDDVIQVFFEASDADGEVADGALIKDNSILIKYFTPEFQETLKGKKVQDSVVLQLESAFPEKEREWIASDLGVDSEEAAGQYYKMTINKIGSVERKGLTKEFFDMVFPGKNIETEEAFRDALKEEIQQQWNQATRNQLHDQLYHILIDTPVEFPEAFLKRWLETNGDKPKTKEEVEAEYPRFINQLKWTGISDKVIQENQLQVTDEELREDIRQELARQFGGLNLGSDMPWLESYIDQMMKDRKNLDNSYRKIITDKVFQWLEQQVTADTKEITPEEFLALQKDHKH